MSDLPPGHTCDKHQPGRTCYIAHKCRCDGCRTDATAWKRRWKWRKQHGGSIMVPADLIRRHLERLEASGMTLAQVSRLSGVDRSILTRAKHGEVQSVMRRNAEAIANVRPGAEDGDARVSSLGVTRRLQSLAAIGWSAEDLAPELGFTAVRVRALRSGRRPAVHAATHRHVDEVWERLAMQPRPGVRMRALAERGGWPPPLAWDDIDDPDEHPTGWRPDAQVARPNGSTAENVSFLSELGESDEAIAHRLGIDVQSVQRARLREAA